MNHPLRQHTALLLGLCLALAACDRQATPKTNTPPQAVLKLTPQEGDGPLLVTADGSASTDSDGSISSYTWDWGDGSANGSGVGSTHTYAAKAAPYTVTLTVTDNGGATNSASAAVTSRSSTVPPAAVDRPVAEFTLTPEQGAAPLAVTVDASKSTVKSGTIVKYDWDWGDGTPSSEGQASSHVYSSQGTFTIKLKVTDGKRQTATTARTVDVGPLTLPSVVSFSPSTAAHKVRADTSIVVHFSQTMNPAGIEKVFKSTAPGFRQGEVSFRWRGNYTVLEVTPNTPLVYGNGQNREVQWRLEGAKDSAGKTMPTLSSKFFLYGLVREHFRPSVSNSGFITERVPKGASTRVSTQVAGLFAGLDNDPSLNHVGQYRSFLSYVLVCPVGSACAAPTPQPTTAKSREVLQATLSLHGLSSVGAPLSKLATLNSACSVGVGTPQPANFVIKSAFYDSLDEGDYSRVNGQELFCHLGSVPLDLNVDVTQAVKNDWANLQGQQAQSQFVMFFAYSNPAPEFNALQIAGPSSGTPPLLSVDFLVDQ